MISIIIALLLPTVLGYVILSFLLRNDSHSGLLERLCLSYPLGMGLHTFQMFFLGLLRVPLTLTYTSLPLVIEITGIFLWLWKNNVPLSPKPSYGFYQEISSPNTKLIKKAALTLLMLWIVAKIISIFYLTSLRPIWAWDAWSNWSASAKAFFYSNSLMLDAPAEDFFGRNIVSRIPAYPLHNHLLQAWLGLCAGGFDEILVKFWTPVYLLSAAVCLYGFAVREVNRILALSITAIFLSSSLMSYHSIEAYSDFPLGIINLLALLSFLHAMRGRDGFWLLTGFFSASSLFTKSESIGIIFPLLLSALVYILQNKKKINARKALISLILPLTLIAPWFVFKAIHSLPAVGLYSKLDLSYHSGVVAQFIKEILTLQNFNVLMILFPVMPVINGRPGKELLHLLFPMASYAVFFALLYTFISQYYNYMFDGTLLFRNVLSYYPSICLLTIIIFGEWLKRSGFHDPVVIASQKRSNKRNKR